MTIEEVIKKWNTFLSETVITGTALSVAYLHEMLSDFKALQQNESKQPDFICPHSGESFNLGDECFLIRNDRYEDFAIQNRIILQSINGEFKNIAYFHTPEKAIEWNKAKFGSKE